MLFPLFIFQSVTVGVVAAIIAGFIANSKGRNWGLWGLFSFFFPFLIFILLFMKALPKIGSTKLCPACKEVINFDAIKCKHCGEYLKVKTQTEPIDITPAMPIVGKCALCGDPVPEDMEICYACRKKQ